MTSLMQTLECFADIAGWIGDVCRAEDALALSTTSAVWFVVLSEPAVWRRYLQGPVEALARPILADPAAAAAFAKVHASNLRAAVAALRMPGWLRRYPSMRRRLESGALLEPLPRRKALPTARQVKARVLRDVKARERKLGRKPSDVCESLRQALDSAVRERATAGLSSSSVVMHPSTPKRHGRPRLEDITMTPPRPSQSVSREPSVPRCPGIGEAITKKRGRLQSSSASSSSSSSSSSTSSQKTPRRKSAASRSSSSASSSSSSSPKKQKPRLRRGVNLLALQKSDLHSQSRTWDARSSEVESCASQLSCHGVGLRLPGQGEQDAGTRAALT